MESRYAGTGGAYVRANHSIAVGDPQLTGGQIWKLAIPTKLAVDGKPAYDPAGKWNIVEDMGDGQSAIVYVGHIEEPVFVYKISKAGL